MFFENISHFQRKTWHWYFLWSQYCVSAIHASDKWLYFRVCNGDGLIANRTSIWFGDHENPLFHIFDYICLHSRKKVFLAERLFFYKVELIILYKKMKLAFGEGNNNEHQLIAAIKLKRRLQAFCFISRRCVEWHCKFAFGTFNTTLNI